MFRFPNDHYQVDIHIKVHNRKNAKALNLVNAVILFNNNFQAGSNLQLYKIYIKISVISI
jgi:hypothetical protein